MSDFEFPWRRITAWGRVFRGLAWNTADKKSCTSAMKVTKNWPIIPPFVNYWQTLRKYSFSHYLSYYQTGYLKLKYVITFTRGCIWGDMSEATGVHMRKKEKCRFYFSSSTRVMQLVLINNKYLISSSYSILITCPVLSEAAKKSRRIPCWWLLFPPLVSVTKTCSIYSFQTTYLKK